MHYTILGYLAFATHVSPPAFCRVAVCSRIPSHLEITSNTIMPADEYASTVRGGLKLKGGAPTGIKKKKKKPKVPSASTGSKASALQAALEDEDGAASKDVVLKKNRGEGPEEEAVAAEGGGFDDGKTASERAHEEMRRKRVCSATLVMRIGEANEL